MTSLIDPLEPEQVNEPAASNEPASSNEPAARSLMQIAHSAIEIGPANSSLLSRQAREERQNEVLATGATRAEGAGNRQYPEEPDPYRTCFERDLDRIHHSPAYRRLAGKCQVFIAPENDHLRTRLTHATEVAQVATGIARPAGLNTALTAAAATAHDCGHGPAGHASETALSGFVDGGYHHAVYGADVVLAPLNLCDETLDAVRNHSWNRPAPYTPEGEVVAWADRIAYCCHDFEDAVRAGIVKERDLPKDVADVIGTKRSSQLNKFVNAMLETIASTGRIGMRNEEAEALSLMRQFNFERIYLRPESVRQSDKVIQLLRSLTSWFIENPAFIGGDLTAQYRPGSREAVEASVRYVSGMTDRFALNLAVEHLGWDRNDLPRAA